MVIFAGTTALLFGFFMLTTTQAFADNGYKGKDKQKELKKQKEQDKEYQKQRRDMNRDSLKQYEKQDRLDYNRRQDYNKYRGYRERPYDQNRIYVNYGYKGHRYAYDGHWRSWEQFGKYAKKHPDIYKHGGYYRQYSHLMFRSCEPDTGSCFYFSIGR
jgi:hypothetical protein